MTMVLPDRRASPSGVGCKNVSFNSSLRSTELHTISIVKRYPLVSTDSLDIINRHGTSVVSLKGISTYKKTAMETLAPM